MDRRNSLKISFKKLDNKASSPQRGSDYAAGWDLTATSMTKERGIISYGTSIGIEIPKGYFAILAARSSVYRTDLILANGLGIIDSDYRGELIFKFRILHEGEYPKVYNIGDRVGQLIILSHATPDWVEADVLGDTDRGSGGFGSSGI
jgi:dUTP pyrophosphatase